MSPCKRRRWSIEIAVVALSIALAAATVGIVLLAGSIPFLWHKAFRMEQKIETLDEAVSAMAAGLMPPPEHTKRADYGTSLRSHFPAVDSDNNSRGS